MWEEQGFKVIFNSIGSLRSFMLHEILCYINKIKIKATFKVQRDPFEANGNMVDKQLCKCVQINCITTSIGALLVIFIFI